MSSVSLKSYRMIEGIGSGGFATVCKAIDTSTGTAIAYKKLRTSLRTERPFLRHESRVLKHLQGHPAIPKILGYQRVPHFEHLSMELLGPSLDTLVEPEHALSPVTVLRVGEQLISALQHLYTRNIIHRDVKPSNVCVSAENPAQVCLIDYNISLPLSPEAMATAPTKRPGDIQLDSANEILMAGSPDWCSLNSHDGMWARPRDDIESLGYTLLYLYFGRLPWRLLSVWRDERYLDQLRRVRGAKEAFLRTLPLSGIPQPINDLLRVARASLGNGDIDEPLQGVREDMQRLIASSGQMADTPLDFTPVPIPSSAPPLMECTSPLIDWEEVRRKASVNPYETDNPPPPADYTEDWDSGYWYDEIRIPGRDPSLTFPESEKVLLDSSIPDTGFFDDE